jgi:hypothetical protein
MDKTGTVPRSSKQRRILSPLDMFALVSGVIGLIVDVCVLVSGLSSSGDWHISSPMAFLVACTVVIYGVTVLSFYARKVFFNGCRSRGIRLTKAKRARIEEAARWLSVAIATPLFVLACSAAFLAAYPPGSPALNALPREERPTLSLCILFSAVFGAIAAYALGALAGLLYGAFDPSLTAD